MVAAQWTGAMGPPILWALRFGLNYALMPLACSHDALALFHAVNLVSLLLLAGMFWLAYRFWSGARAAPHAGTTDLVRRTRFMGLFGMMSSALFFIVVVAEGLANVLIDPCLTAGPLVPH